MVAVRRAEALVARAAGHIEARGDPVAEPEEPFAVKAGTIVLTLAAGWVAQKVIGSVWEKATGNVAPKHLDDDEITAIQAVAFAAVSGGVAVLAKRLARRGAVRAAARFVSAK